MGPGSRPSTFSLTSPGPLRLYSTRELLTLPPPTWLIAPILPAGGLVGLYGPPEHGKSFLAIDMALCVATGQPWQGHTVQTGLVLYVSAEGGTGIAKRVAAWLQFHDVRPTDARVAWLIEALPISASSEDMDTLLSRIEDEVEEHPTLIVLDTLARCFVHEGDENLQKDMGRFICGVDWLRREFGATVMIVHHTRLDGTRERGSTNLRGGADTMIFVKKKGDALTVTCDKQRDTEHFETIELLLEKVPTHDSCVVVPERVDRDVSLLKIVSQEQKPISFSKFVQLVKAHGLTEMSPATFKRRLVSLRKSGKIIRENGLYSLNKAHKAHGVTLD